MKVHKKISRLRSYFEAVWVSARFYSMLRKMNRLRAEGTENRQEIFWSILCSLMSVRGIFTFISGYVEMMGEMPGHKNDDGGYRNRNDSGNDETVRRGSYGNRNEGKKED